jgi:hypothetical protein
LWPTSHEDANFPCGSRSSSSSAFKPRTLVRHQPVTPPRPLRQPRLRPPKPPHRRGR